MGWFSDINRRLRGKPTRGEERQMAEARGAADRKKKREDRTTAWGQKRTGRGSRTGYRPSQRLV